MSAVLGLLTGKQIQFVDKWGKPVLQEEGTEVDVDSDSDYDDWRSNISNDFI